MESSDRETIAVDGLADGNQARSAEEKEKGFEQESSEISEDDEELGLCCDAPVEDSIADFMVSGIRLERCGEFERGSRRGAETQRLKDDVIGGCRNRREESYTRLRRPWSPRHGRVKGGAGKMILVLLTKHCQQAGSGTEVFRRPFDQGHIAIERLREAAKARLDSV